MPLKTIVLIHPALTHYHYPRLQALGQAAREMGIQVTSLVLAGAMQAYPWQTEGRLETFHNLTLFPDRSLESIPGSELWAALQPRLANLQPEVVFFYGYSLGILRQGKLWCDQHKTATVLISDSNIFDKPRARIFEFLKSIFVRRYDAAFVGGASSSDYLQHLGLPPERIVAGYDVIDVAMFSHHAAQSRQHLSDMKRARSLPPNYFLVVARLIPEKNLPGLLSAYAAYHAQTSAEQEPWDLVLCGDGPEAPSLRTQLANFSPAVRSKVHLHGYIRQPELIDFFAAAGCLVLPSLSESWGLVVNEALACSLPVLVSSQAGCARDLVQDGQNGWTFDPHDLDALSELLGRMARLPPAARAGLGQHSREIISAWGLDRFAAGALDSARLAMEHRHPAKHVLFNQSEEVLLVGKKE
ncbi:MAG: glycosyltransferase family 4 protein [Anaerolineales bacterium]|jgi:glycosyltransferase involved in cell wall biosynthesis